MTEKDIKPIPKYIIQKIAKFDAKSNPTPNGHLRFYSYLAIWKKELVKVTVAVKHYRKKFYVKQVAIHGLNSDHCFVKDMEYNYLGAMGYRVGWHEQGITKHRAWYESERWGIAQDKYYDPYAPIVNKELIAKLPEYKYSAYELYNGDNILKYLRLYDEYPQIEYLMKLGLKSIAQSVTILKKVGKDKQFCKWLIRNKEQLNKQCYYVESILKSYKYNLNLNDIQLFLSRKKILTSDKTYAPIRELFKGKLLERFFLYIDKQKISYSLYSDYLKACKYLKLDMTEDKNRFPRDFMRWHDIRIDEYRSAKAKADEREKEAFYKQFATVAEKYLQLQRNKNGFVVIIAKSPADLTKEGELLHHCVGAMGYDRKVIREESLIFFIRNALTPETPLVTVEYSLTKKKVLQCYGEHNSKPNEAINTFIQKTWLPYANRQLKKIA